MLQSLQRKSNKKKKKKNREGDKEDLKKKTIVSKNSLKSSRIERRRFKGTPYLFFFIYRHLFLKYGFDSCIENKITVYS